MTVLLNELITRLQEIAKIQINENGDTCGDLPVVISDTVGMRWNVKSAYKFDYSDHVEPMTVIDCRTNES